MPPLLPLPVLPLSTLRHIVTSRMLYFVSRLVPSVKHIAYNLTRHLFEDIWALSSG